MKVLVFLLLVAFNLAAQVETPESLLQQLTKPVSAREKVDLQNKLSHVYSQLSLETSEQFAQEALRMATELKYAKGIATSYNNLGICSSIRGDYTAGLDYFLKSLKIREELGDVRDVSYTLNNISRLFIYRSDFEKALEYAKRSLAILNDTNDARAVGGAHLSLGSIYKSKGDPAEAMKMFMIARDLFSKENLKSNEAGVMLEIANLWESQGMHAKALQTCFTGMGLVNSKDDLFTTIELYNATGSIYANQGNLKEATNYLHQAIRMADRGFDNNSRMTSRRILADVFQKFQQLDSALYYKDAYLKLHTEIFTIEKSRQLATLEKIYDSEKKDQLLELRNQKIQSQSIIIATISALLVVLIILGFIIFRYYRDKRKSNIKLEQLNREINEKHNKISAQAIELTQANQEISRMNNALEAEVAHRTEKIEMQNKLLIEYAYSNAHNVRGPLARILGLATLMSIENDSDRLKEYNNFIHISAQELDTVIREINVKLQNESK